MNMTFNYKKNILNGEFVEYEIYLASGEIFCHLSESDFKTFWIMCQKSSCRLLRRV
jgi:hypothetical protein